MEELGQKNFNVQVEQNFLKVPVTNPGKVDRNWEVMSRMRQPILRNLSFKFCY